MHIQGRTHAIVEAILARREEVIERLMDAAIPGYPRRHRYPDLEEAVAQAFDVIVARMRDGRRLEPEHLPFARAEVRKAAMRGGSEMEILQAPLRAQRVLWEFLVEVSSDSPEDQEALVRVAPVLLGYVEASSAVTHEAYLDVHDAVSSRSSIARYELIEGLINGVKPAAGIPLNLARRCGLDHNSSLIVMVARRVGEVKGDDDGLDFAVSALARLPGDHTESLAVKRESQIVVIRSTGHRDTDRLNDQLEQVRDRMGQAGTGLAIATSAVHEGLVAVPEAYGEACQTLERIPDSGVLALATLSAIDYLVIRAGNQTAWQLLPEAVRTFVAEDMADGEVLTNTLRAYIDADQNVKRASEQLFVHPNTGHYRLDRIASRTGCNLRNFDDLTQIMVAVKLATANRWSTRSHAPERALRGQPPARK